MSLLLSIALSAASLHGDHQHARGTSPDREPRQQEHGERHHEEREGGRGHHDEDHGRGHGHRGRRHGASTPEGSVPWYEGPFEEALVEARAQGTQVLIEFWTPDCHLCRRVAHESLCDEVVLGELRPLVCVQVDASSPTGREVARRFGVRGYPTLLFFDGDGAPIDALRGYHPREELLDELRRVRAERDTIADLELRIANSPSDLGARFDLLEKLQVFGEAARMDEQREAITALVALGEGYDPGRVESRWELSRRLWRAGLRSAAREQREAIRQLDPAGTSLAMRRMALEELEHRLHHARDPHAELAPLEDFLRSEVHPELRFEAALRLYELRSRAANRSRDAAVRRTGRETARRDAVTLWTLTPAERRAEVGAELAWDLYLEVGELASDELAFALQVSTAAAEASEGDPLVLDTLACLLNAMGRTEEALATLARCEQLDPGHPLWARRRAGFTPPAVPAVSGAR